VTNSFRLIAIAFGVIALVSIMVKTTLRSAVRPKALHSVYLKIFMNYLQLVTLAASFSLDWPSMVVEVFKVQEQAGSVTD